VGDVFGEYTGWPIYGINVFKDTLYCMHDVEGLQIFDLY
jgi:hypothetical protein